MPQGNNTSEGAVMLRPTSFDFTWTPLYIQIHLIIFALNFALLSTFRNLRNGLIRGVCVKQLPPSRGPRSTVGPPALQSSRP